MVIMEKANVNVMDAEGLVAASLKRSSREIREQRGQTIAEDLEIEYDRRIQDLERDIRRIRRDQEQLFDFSPNNALSMVMKDVDAVEVMEKDLEMEKNIRNMEILLNNAKKRYNLLFTKKYEIIKELM